MSKRIDIAMKAALAAGEIINKNKNTNISIEIKDDKSLVTDIDSACEKAITNILKSEFPSDGIMGEEGTSHGNDDDYLWIIDPIDGTHNFIRGIPLYGVSIGLVKKGEFAGGVLYMPVFDELYVAEKGSGAFKNGNMISVSNRSVLSECSLSFDSGLKRGIKEKPDVLKALGRECFNVRMTGASSILMTYLAEGRVDIAVEFDDKPWDFAAGAILIQEAGGMFTSIDGGHANYKTEGYVATNGKVHDQVVNIIGKVINKGN